MHDRPAGEGTALPAGGPALAWIAQAAHSLAESVRGVCRLHEETIVLDKEAIMLVRRPR
jgi:hypothetical protein